MLELTDAEKKDFEDALFKLKWGLDYWKEAFDKLPKKITEDVMGDSDYGYEKLAKIIFSSLQEMEKFEETINRKHQEIIDKLDKTWISISKKHYEVDEKIKKLTHKSFEFDTYRMKEILTLLEHISRYNDEDWRRFELICGKLKRES